MGKVIYPQLSYKIIGILYKVYNKIGFGYQEKYYQRALKVELERQKIIFKEQFPISLRYDQVNIGKYYIDFLIDNKIVLELKTEERFYDRDYRQILSYLKSTKLKLGILARFSKKGVYYRRILNLY